MFHAFLSRVTTLSLVGFFFTSASWSDPSKDQWLEDYSTISSVEMQELPDPDAEAFMRNFSWEDNCTTDGWYEPKTGTVDELNSIIALGEKAWKIVEAGRPVVAVRSPVVHAVPAHITCWNELEGWQPPKSALWQIVYKNGYGVEVVKFNFRILFNYGGGMNGVGQYVANATTIPAEISVAWGFSLDAEVNVGRTVNTGTRKNPIAGMQFAVNWRVKSVLKEMINTENFFVTGDGSLRKLD